MRLHPIIAALRKHTFGVALIALQIALTLAIVCNALFIIGERMARIDRPTGLNESDLFLVSQMWVGAPAGSDAASTDKLDSMLLQDLATLRGLPDVAAAGPMNSLPLYPSSHTSTVSQKPGTDNPGTLLHTNIYFADDHAIPTLGLKLVAGQNFSASDVQHRRSQAGGQSPTTIVTKALADRLFPDGQAVGRQVYFDGSASPSTIVGVVERLQVPGTSRWTNGFAWYSAIEPVRLDRADLLYVVRAKPGRLAAAMKEVPAALYAVNPMRVLDDDSVESFADVRAHAYRADIGMAILMGGICLVLLGITAASIVGLTSFWVGQRHHQIGVRRALGARRKDILRYFQIENLVIAGAGTAAGAGLAIGLNVLLMRYFEMNHLPALYLVAGALIVLALGQGAVLVPARRASRVPPAVATRGR
ncbi:ABC transporter permease [Dyella mobilis]|uniref:ABC transporter permease n=1 Tax=Dyella mobilis TaxID=1849582 RepID=A0ABS2KM85_9GAMM|nr:FtsX-like permease family protein [Dyella mobilis]MBM7132271.1 ABC transporter permease [Dyella mobilis]GLQ95744.1 ABC transporter permease [Dyella mobilis]